MIDLGISTIAAESIKYDDVNWETKHHRRVREIKARRAAGLEETAGALVEIPAAGQSRYVGKGGIGSLSPLGEG